MVAALADGVSNHPKAKQGKAMIGDEGFKEMVNKKWVTGRPQYSDRRLCLSSMFGLVFFAPRGGT